MAFCSKCGAQMDAGTQFCAKCGTKVDGAPAAQTVQASAPQGGYQQAASVGNEDVYIEAYIGKNADFYKNVFARYDANGGNFTFCFSWAAFLITGINLFYRRVGWGIFIFIIELALSWTVIGAIIWGIVFGFVNPYIIYKNYRNAMDSYKNMPHEEKIAKLRAFAR